MYPDSIDRDNKPKKNMGSENEATNETVVVQMEEANKDDGPKLLVLSELIELLKTKGEGATVEGLNGLTKPQIVDVLASVEYGSVANRGIIADEIIAHNNNDKQNNKSEEVNEEEVAIPFRRSLIQAQERPPIIADASLEVANWKILAGHGERIGPLLRSGLLEFIGAGLLEFVHIGIVRTAVASGNLFPMPIMIAIGHIPLIALTIFVLSAPSGGHVVSTITIATTFTGHTTWLRGALYLCAQVCGTIFGSLMYRAVLGWDNVTGPDLAACSVGDLGPGAAFAAEFMYTMMTIVWAFGIAFDPKQGQLFGPILGPICVATGLGLLLFASSANTSIPGAGIPSIAWTICLGPSVALGTAGFETLHWVYLTAQVLACGIHALVFLGAPPHHAKEGVFTPVLLREKIEYQKKKAALASSSKEHKATL